MQNFVILTKCACFMTPMLVSHVFVNPSVCDPCVCYLMFVPLVFSSLFIGLPLVSSHVSLMCLFLCVN